MSKSIALSAMGVALFASLVGGGLLLLGSTVPSSDDALQESASTADRDSLRLFLLSEVPQEGILVDHGVEIKNPDMSDREIIVDRISCGCVSVWSFLATDDKKRELGTGDRVVLPSGSQARIIMGYKVYRREETQSHSTYLSLKKDGVVENLGLRVTTRVLPDVRVSPPVVSGTADFSRRIVRQFKVTALRRAPGKRLPPTISGAEVEFETVSIEPGAEDRYDELWRDEWSVSVVLRPSHAAYAQIVGELLVSFEDVASGECRIPVTVLPQKKHAQ